MPAPIEISDPADPRLSDFRDLARADRRPDRPGGRGLVIAEGVPVVQRLLASRYPVRAVLGFASRLQTLSGELSDLPAPVYLATAEVMATVVGFHLNRGVLASADRPPTLPVEEVLDLAAFADDSGRPHGIGAARRIAALEGVNDHENLGSIFRNAAAFGVEAILLGPGCSDPLYRRSIRVSMGHVLSVPFTELASSSRFAAWPEAITELRRAGFCVLALTPRPGSQPLQDLDPARYLRTAVLVGAEGPGLSEQALDAADLRVRIPMRPGVDSLNVATAAAIAFAHLGPPM